MLEQLDESPSPHRSPTLSELEAAPAYAAMAQRRTVEWLMSSEVPDLDILLAELVNRPAWHRRAEGKGLGTVAFFPTRGESTEIAKAMCAHCEVRQECQDAALADPATSGIWGGLSERGRRQMRRGAVA